MIMRLWIRSSHNCKCRWFRSSTRLCATSASRRASATQAVASAATIKSASTGAWTGTRTQQTLSQRWSSTSKAGHQKLAGSCRRRTRHRGSAVVRSLQLVVAAITCSSCNGGRRHRGAALMLPRR